MDKRVYFLMIVSFIVGMVELIISGLVDLIAEDLNVSLAAAGFLVTIFSLIFAIAAPILLLLTAKIERKKLTLNFLFLFLIGNIISVLSPTYTILFIGRTITAFSCALLIILCLVMAPKIVEPKYRGRAIGIVSMGVSGSLVLGVPIGLMLGETFSWRAPFVLITILTALSIIGVYFWMDRVEPSPPVPLKVQLATLRSRKILFAHLTTFLYMTGHSVLYTYFKPFLQETMGGSATWISVLFLVFGVAAVSGGGIGGTLADTLGTKRTIVVAIIIFGAVMMVIPYTTNILPVFLFMLVVWGVMSWAISPAMQSYLIESSPSTSEIQQSLSNSALHFGIASGAFLGGIIIGQATTHANAFIGGLLIIASLGTMYISLKSKQTEIAVN
ncbi:MFS transporter [Ornithinibacillus halotolerans]|uniref:Chloramphenicol resistance protein n=1 Tax=Ornithinibacillus halotolerans TaxID=1274357 RepID=A0A916W959_9BACI|nr:MFS transporter [Ornithinibacillus halotolerans]GGA78408.1 chloramphenicol resistance protein [Ornithinibacillus halotolerans]